MNLFYSILYILLTKTIGVNMEFIKNTLIGVGAFAVLFAIIFSAEYLLRDFAGLTSEQIGNVLMIAALLIITPMFGGLTRSVFKLDKS